ncbi:MAG: hypothetical protein JWL91_1424 [Sphingomonas bacterium]|nr:sulfotransferase family 2 domain-containing protein [Sphingomonas bacterium]MDB5689548.1 hypothetical protein [Sphingomonas bacterium]
MPPAKSPPSIPLRIVNQTALSLCRVSLAGDLHERAAELSLRLPLSRRRAERIECIRQAGVLFVHVPKCAGMAVCQALYGRQLKHGTIRWYRRRARELNELPSFAILREPVERFVSAYRYAVAGGSADNRVSAAFHDRYRKFRCLDEAIDHVEGAASPYRLDHIFRPQHWYVADREGGIGVDRLFCMEDPAIPRFIQDHGGASLAQVNRSHTPFPAVSAEQSDRIRSLYRSDVALYAAVSA